MGFNSGFKGLKHKSFTVRRTQPPSFIWTQLHVSAVCNLLRANIWYFEVRQNEVESSWNVMAHGDTREGKWRGNCRMEWVASTLYTTSELGVSSITNADTHTLVASSRLNWRPCRFQWTSPFRRKTKSGISACAITFQMKSTSVFTTRFTISLYNFVL